MRFQMPDTMKGKDGKFPDSIVTGGSQYDVDEDTGVFEAPDGVKDSLACLNISGANAPRVNAVAPKVEKPADKVDPVNGPTPDEIDVLLAGMTYEGLGEELARRELPIRNKKSERVEDLRAAMLAPKE